MASRIPAKKSARSLSAWRAKNPAAALVKLLTRRVLGVERQIDQDDQRIFELNSELVAVRNRLQMRTRAAAVAISDLTKRLKSAEENLRHHEQALGSLSLLVMKSGLLDRIPQDQYNDQLHNAVGLIANFGGRSQSATGSLKGSRNRTKDSPSET